MQKLDTYVANNDEIRTEIKPQLKKIYSEAQAISQLRKGPAQVSILLGRQQVPAVQAHHGHQLRTNPSLAAAGILAVRLQDTGRNHFPAGQRFLGH